MSQTSTRSRVHASGRAQHPQPQQPATRAEAAPGRAPTPTKARHGDAQIALQSPVQYVKGVGPKLSELLARRGVHCVDDLLRFLPRRYEARQGAQRISDAQPGVVVTVTGEVRAVSQRRVRGRQNLDVLIGDASGALQLRWFRVPGKNFAERFQQGQCVRASGQVKRFRGRLQMVHPEVDIKPDAPTAPPRDAILPVYPEVEGVRPAQLRRVMQTALAATRELIDPIPEPLRRKRDLPHLATAIRALHAPPADARVEALQRGRSVWHERLIYEELLVLQLAVLTHRVERESTAAAAIELAQPLRQTAAGLFPFTPTNAQQRVLDELDADLRQAVPTHRLLQGDVGSGKTAVALTAAVAVARAGYQTALMAPTEVLAEQHARTALKVLSAAGVRMALLTGSMPAAERRQVLARVAAGDIKVLVGTHAVIQNEVEFGRLAFAIVDEQHRFGVMQRARLVELGRASLGLTPHILVMTATPIPRTLALTLYGDLKVSVIDALPPGRQPIATRVYGETQRRTVYAAVRQAVESGRQAYVVFPLVESSDKEGMESVRAASEALAELSAGALNGLRLGLLHGKMSGDDKDLSMRRFANGEIDVLVATTVIEVGVDVPNATVMVIEHAERFGLSQLHQLRGRVGRGEHASQCYLVAAGPASEEGRRRLRVMEDTNDGFRIAEEDLQIRGPGDVMGTRQSGVPLLSVANLMRDQDWLNAAREDAQAILHSDPQLRQPEHAGLQLLQQAWAQKLTLARVG